MDNERNSTEWDRREEDSLLFLTSADSTRLDTLTNRKYKVAPRVCGCTEHVNDYDLRNRRYACLKIEIPALRG